MTSVTLTAETFQRVVVLCDLQEVVIRVCGKDFSINQSILPFISTNLAQYFDNSDKPFIVSLNYDDQSDSLFENVTLQSLIKSCSIFLALVENCAYSDTISIHIPSLILFSKKIFCDPLLDSAIKYSKSFHSNSSMTFEIPNYVLKSFSKLSAPFHWK
jgi:hypothetical protein